MTTEHILHPTAKYEGDLIYRFNTDLSRWEFWAYDEGCWRPSLYRHNTRVTPPFAAEGVVSFSSTWAEPLYDPTLP